MSETAKKVTSGVVGTTVEATKGIADEIPRVLKREDKGATSPDGSMVRSTPEEVWEVTAVTVLEAKASGETFASPGASR